MKLQKVAFKEQVETHGGKRFWVWIEQFAPGSWAELKGNFVVLHMGGGVPIGVPLANVKYLVEAEVVPEKHLEEPKTQKVEE